MVCTRRFLKGEGVTNKTPIPNRIAHNHFLKMCSRDAIYMAKNKILKTGDIPAHTFRNCVPGGRNVHSRCKVPP